MDNKLLLWLAVGKKTSSLGAPLLSISKLCVAVADDVTIDANRLGV